MYTPLHDDPARDGSLPPRTKRTQGPSTASPSRATTKEPASSPSAAPSATALAAFHFAGDVVPTALDDGGLWLDLHALCSVFQKDFGGQLKTLKKEPWVKLAKFASNRSGPGKKARYHLHVDSLPGWLFGLQTAGMAPDLLAKLIRYKAESAQALRDYWLGGGAINPRVTRPQASRFLEALEIVLADDPIRHRSLWVKKLAGVLAQLRGRELGEGLYPFPIYLVRDVGKLYEILLGKETYAKVRQRTGRGSARTKRYHALRSPAYETLDRELGKVEMLALQCRTMAEFWDRVRFHYEGVPLQLGFGYERDDSSPRRR